MLDKMEKEAKKRNAPVFQASSYLKNDPWLRFIFVILSSRTKDEKTLQVVKQLKHKCNTWECIKNMPLKELEKVLKGVGFHRQKAKNLKEIAKKLKGKEILCEFDQLITLPGIGRKIANVILVDICSKDAIGVDTHVHRIANRLGWVNTKTPEETEKELKHLVPKKLWNKINKALVGYGQTVCLPVKPQCNECVIKEKCMFYKSLTI